MTMSDGCHGRATMTAKMAIAMYAVRRSCRYRTGPYAARAVA